MAVHPLIEKVLAARPPIADLIGFTVEEIGAGRAVGSLQSGPEHANPMANSVYSATKAAVRSFARTWTTDSKARHIRVNAVSPGSIE